VARLSLATMFSDRGCRSPESETQQLDAEERVEIEGLTAGTAVNPEASSRHRTAVPSCAGVTPSIRQRPFSYHQGSAAAGGNPWRSLGQGKPAAGEEHTVDAWP